MAWNGKIPINDNYFDLSSVVATDVYFTNADKNGVGDVTAIFRAPVPYVSRYDDNLVGKVKFGLVDTWNNPTIEDPSTLPTVHGMIRLSSPYKDMIAVTEDGRLSYHGDIDRGHIAFHVAVTIESLFGESVRKIVAITLRRTEQSTTIPTT